MKSTDHLRSQEIKNLLDKTAWVAFLAFLACIPVTSFPLFPPAIGGDALVRPLSVYPLTLLVFLVILPRLFRDRLPRHLLALGFFVLVVVASGFVSLLKDINPSSDVSSPERVARVLVTLALGCAIYLAVTLTPRTKEELRAGLRALILGFTAALAWGTLQLVYVVHFNKYYFRLINELQGLLSIRKLMNNRVSGMTYEPNWFGEQITVLLIPWLLAAVLSGSSSFRWRWRWLTVELCLLIWSVLLLPFTFSRAGLLNLAVITVVAIILVWFLRSHREEQGTRVKNTRRSWSRILRLVVEIIVVLSIVLGLFYAASTRNEFFGRLWDYWERPNASVRGYLVYIGMEARMIYSETAFNTFKTSPILGVGPGNYALYFADMLPYRPLARTPEVLRMITPEEGRERLVTAKNFVLRLLAETGILGSAAFFAFGMAIIGSVLFLWLSPNPEEKFWGIGGILALTAFILSTLSFDSFAIPNMWVIFGFITSAAILARYQTKSTSPQFLEDKIDK